MRVLVCGSNYGATYIRALAASQDSVRLAGILSTGSARSLAYARQTQVPHYTDMASIPDGSIDMACVAVPGETGNQLSLALLAKGIHVICEHPIGPEQMRKALAVAQEHGRLFQVNAHFADLLAPQAFYQGLAVAQHMGPPLHFDLAANLRTLYSGLDLVGRALGSLADIQVIPPPATGDSPPMFASLLLVSPTLHISLLCQNFASAADDGTATLLNHRCSATFAHGNLLLAESNGPVLWFPSPVSMPIPQWRNYLPVDMNQIDANALQQQRDQANRAVINQMVATINGQAQAAHQPPAHQQPEYLLALASVWEQVLYALQPAIGKV
ncbi:Gfo/Idh/MocA family oxidoreductase [Undibacterium sp. Ji49W]|uniref:Gfo/Idh/MocA family oxidoreductase n=1 Tax=Undibacterium sp. Ji49W TaxID=3413040 RepID=UPI003BF20FDC